MKIQAGSATALRKLCYEKSNFFNQRLLEQEYYNAINYLTDKKRLKERIENEKQLRIERYEEEIEDYLLWRSEEAKLRLVGLIRRMNIEGETKLFLWMAYLKKALLMEANLAGAYLEKADIKLYQLKGAHLSSDTMMMDGTKYDESWAKRIAEAEEPKNCQQG